MYQEQYRTTELEDWVSTMYNKMGITKPSLINEQTISRYFEIFLKKKPMNSSFHIFGRYRDIVIDEREPLEKQREIFFHELCHILRHAGIQSMMPTAFRELQEWDAQHFTQYAAIPHHMLKYIPFQEHDVVNQMSLMFQVSPELCEMRLEQVKRRLQTTRNITY
ncbi:ImmA/IrrE family metallo-endopeptidase [Rossellomorea aquimaris]|nr:ImmA/IrrE family metallo-endopeptidase [Rossellomorea aquimaris]